MEYEGVFYGHLVYFTAIWSILRPFGILCGHLVCLMVIWHTFSTVGVLSQGNLAILV
jgi:hypothetical protein